MRFASLWESVRDITGRSRSLIVEDINKQLATCLQAAQIADELSKREIAADEALDSVGSLIVSISDARAGFLDRLSRSIATPFDREDLLRVSRSLADICSNLGDYVREVSLFDAQRETDGISELTGLITGTIDGLSEAVELLLDSPNDVPYATRRVRAGCTQIRQTYQALLGDLLVEKGAESTSIESTKSLLRRRELLRRLDIVGLRLGEAVDALDDGGMKRVQ